MYNRKELEHEIDMISGNINRMCVAETDKELHDMYRWAEQRLANIYMQNRMRLNERFGDSND